MESHCQAVTRQGRWTRLVGLEVHLPGVMMMLLAMPLYENISRHYLGVSWFILVLSSDGVVLWWWCKEYRYGRSVEYKRSGDCASLFTLCILE
jgi:hypothetical protein